MNGEASALMKRGIALLEEAVGLFERAIGLRRELVAPGDHWMAYLTAASWMNRGDALTRLGGVARIEEAVRSYDEALEVLKEVAPEINPLYRRRHAIAWMNRGITLHEHGTAANFEEAVRSFDQAIGILAGHVEHQLILACAWMNRGNALLRTKPARAGEARDSALEARGLVAELEQADFTAAETGLKARHIICQGTAELMPGDPKDGGMQDLLATATDAVEEGLGICRHWEGQGEIRFRPLMRGLFRFGVAVYRAHQAQFLAEFVLENLGGKERSGGLSGDVEMHAMAAEALGVAARELHHDGFAAVNTPRFEKMLETLRVLRIVEGQIQELRANGNGPGVVE